MFSTAFRVRSRDACRLYRFRAPDRLMDPFVFFASFEMMAAHSISRNVGIGRESDW